MTETKKEVQVKQEKGMCLDFIALMPQCGALYAVSFVSIHNLDRQDVL